MTYTLLDILQLIGAIGFFIYGMKIMSEGIQKIAGNQMRKVLNAVTSNTVYSFFSGLLTTVIVQASSATTVMVVGFSHAGLLTLKQGVGLIIGANVGTTVKAILWASFGFNKFELSTLALPIIAIAFPLFFSAKTRYKSWAEFLIGFAILFMALDFIKMSIPELSPEVLRFVTQINNHTLGSTLFFILLGTLITVAIQSSSTAFALTLVLCNQGIIDFEAAAAIVLGENIGTTVTANLAALVANYHGKRAALAHTLHNVLGVILILPFNHWFLQGIDHMLVSFGEPSPLTSVAGMSWGITAYHIAFNASTGLINLIFLSPFIQLVERLIPARSETGSRLAYVGSGFMKTPELALLEVYTELETAGKTTLKMAELSAKLVDEVNPQKMAEITDQIKALENQTDVSKRDIEIYLNRLREDEVSAETVQKIQILQAVSSDLERIADLFVSLSKTFTKKRENNIYFLPEQRQALKAMVKQVQEAFTLMVDNFENLDAAQWEKAAEMEQLINGLRNELRDMQRRDLEAGDFNTRSADLYAEIYSTLERIGDFVYRVAQSMQKAG
ncbi:MAG TPA: Na/Pi cotransporter family protein [Luteibaculaceae bacterium]|nr:Na/Pi cotransporter family protein [Luteibaculaceae bacterium]